MVGFSSVSLGGACSIGFGVGGIDKAGRMHYLYLPLVTLLSTTATGGSSSTSPDPFQSLPPEEHFRAATSDHRISHKSNPPWAIIMWALAAGIFLILVAIKVFCWLSSSPAPAANTAVLGVPVPNTSVGNNSGV